MVRASAGIGNRRSIGANLALSAGVTSYLLNESAKSQEGDELGRLQHVLDRVYTRLRERAARQWAHRASQSKDPADACVHVRITAGKQSLPHPRLAQRNRLHKSHRSRKHRSRTSSHHCN
jgi:hypothetical protein